MDDRDGIDIDAAVIGRGFDLEPGRVAELLRAGRITSRLYRGEGEDEGRWLCVFFHGNARLSITVDAAGRPIGQSKIDFGDRPLPASLRRP